MTKLSKEETKGKNARAGASLTALYTLQSVEISLALSCIATLVTLIIMKVNNVTTYTQGVFGYLTDAFILFRTDFLGIALFWGLCNGIVWTCYKQYQQRDKLERSLGYTLSLIGIITGGFFLPYWFADLRMQQTSSLLLEGKLFLSVGIFVGLGAIVRLIIIRIKKEPRWEFPLFV